MENEGKILKEIKKELVKIAYSEGIRPPLEKLKKVEGRMRRYLKKHSYFSKKSRIGIDLFDIGREGTQFTVFCDNYEIFQFVVG